MTEAWQGVAAARFNETIRMTPQEEDDWAGTPLPEREPVTMADHFEKIFESQLAIMKLTVDALTPGR